MQHNINWSQLGHVFGLVLEDARYCFDDRELASPLLRQNNSLNSKPLASTVATFTHCLYPCALTWFGCDSDMLRAVGHIFDEALGQDDSMTDDYFLSPEEREDVRRREEEDRDQMV